MLTTFFPLGLHAMDVKLVLSKPEYTVQCAMTLIYVWAVIKVVIILLGEILNFNLLRGALKNKEEP